MLQNCDGFTFIEVMFALVILTVTIASTAPVLYVVLNERQTVSEQLIAYEVLHNSIEEFRASKGQASLASSFERNGTQYEQYTTYLNRDLHVCIHWEGRNKRVYEECGVVSYD